MTSNLVKMSKYLLTSIALIITFCVIVFTWENLVRVNVNHLPEEPVSIREATESH